jgi:hypothetical protein
MITRRDVVLGLAACTASIVAMRDSHGIAAQSETFEIVHTPEEWRKRLTPEQYDVLREHDTEAPFTSPLNAEKRAGSFACAGCDLPLFSSETNMTAAPAGPASGSRSTTPSARGKTAPSSSCCAPRCIAGAAAVIWGMYSTTDRRPPACATA